jgi:hypothetical protein
MNYTSLQVTVWRVYPAIHSYAVRIRVRDVNRWIPPLSKEKFTYNSEV